MKLTDIFNAAEGRVCNGSEFQWLCWGGAARYMDFADADGMEFCSAVFDTKTYNVYEVELFVPGTDQCFKWINPEFKDAYLNECKVRDLHPFSALDNIYFAELTDVETVIQYTKDIAATYYDDLPILESQ